MLINLHKKATTTPAIRDYIRTCGKPIKVLARELNLNVNTVRKWRGREESQDASHRPHHLQTTLSPAQETLVVELRRTLYLSLDDLVAIIREYIHPQASRAGVGRLLKREGVSRLAELIPAEERATIPVKTFKDYAPGYLHIDLKELPQMPDEAGKSYLAVAIDRASRWVYFEILPDKTAQGTRAFAERLAAVCPFKIEKILTDNGKEFTDRFTAQGEREPTGRHPFDQACQAIGAEHRLIPPHHPQTNGMVERFNGRIAELLRSTRFQSAAELSTALGHYLQLYNGRIPQRALGHLCPIQTLKAWQEKEPERFNCEIHNLAGLDSYIMAMPKFIE
ncbi:MAG: IS481 family transposase [Methylococcaceae bacterium]